MSIRLIFEIVENNYKYKKLKSYADLNRMILGSYNILDYIRERSRYVDELFNFYSFDNGTYLLYSVYF